MKNKGKLWLAIIILAIAIFIPAGVIKASTTTKIKGIKVEAFIKQLVTALKLPVDKSQEQPYIEAALKEGVLKEGEFKNYDIFLTRTDSAVLLNRADEYLNGNTVEDKLLQTVLDKRISDIKKIPSGKREDVAKIVAKGIIKGYSNGKYIQNREFRGNELITSSGAKTGINLVLNPKQRAKISPDGQLIRTTNLPKNYKDFDYILECFPNSFYERLFGYQATKYYYEPIELKHYASPVKIKYRTTKSEYIDIQEALRLYKDEWIKKVEVNLHTRLNVDYRTIDKDNTWLETLRNTYFIFGSAESDKREIDEIKKYIKAVKKNKVIIKSEVIAVEPSTLYYATGYRVRAYVKFKVVSATDMSKPSELFYGAFSNEKPLKKGVSFVATFDINLGTSNGSSDGSDYAVFRDMITDYAPKRPK